ncbi:MAG: hypothetical protein L6V86_01470 [Treponema sp.]|nr:MAG: hypothetical protein L6V86_01470 [Treponema sp.]
MAVDKVKEAIRDTDRLSPYIQENDKEPIWDGFVYVYNDCNQNNDNLRGRVAVQVKGKEYKEKNDFKNKIKYPVKVSSLSSFLRDGGAIFFVVCLKQNAYKIYFAEFSPLIIKHYLHEADAQKTINIEFSVFPEETKTKESLFINFYENCIKQTSFINGDQYYTLSDIQKNKDIKRVYGTVYGNKGDDLLAGLVRNTTYLYAELQNGLSVPIDSFGLMSYAKLTQNSTVRIKDKIYYNHIERVLYQKNVTVRIGKGTTITLNDLGVIQFSYKIPKYLSDVKFDIEFLRDAILNEGFTIDNFNFPLRKEDIEKSSFNIKFINAVYEECQRYSKVLEVLNCKHDLDYSSLTDADKNSLNVLYVTLVQNKTISPESNTAPVQTGRAHINIANLNFLLELVAVPNRESEYSYFDLFSHSISIRSVQDENVIFPRYFLIETTDFIKADNITLDKVVPELKEFGLPNEYFDMVFQTLVALYSAFDKLNEDLKNIPSKENKRISNQKITDLFFVEEDRDVEFKKQKRDKLHTILDELIAFYETTSTASLKQENYEKLMKYIDIVTNPDLDKVQINNG